MRKALIVGVDDYPNAPLSGCVNDAHAMAAVLESHGDGSPNFSVRLMTSPSEDIDRTTLRAAIETLYEGDAEIALLYFSGHGLIKSTGGYIVTQDFKKYDEGISMDDILILANQSKAQERIILFDCCRSGAFGSPAISGQATAQLAEGLTVLTASRDSESALEHYDVAYFMASTDSLEDVTAFAAQNEANFPILSDPDKRVCKDFGVLSERGYARRWTFYIDKDGLIQHIDKSVNPGSAGPDLTQNLARLGFDRVSNQ